MMLLIASGVLDCFRWIKQIVINGAMCSRIRSMSPYAKDRCENQLGLGLGLGPGLCLEGVTDIEK